MGEMRRYALYYAPRQVEPLASFARSWLGRDPDLDVDCPRIKLRDISPERLAEITADPRHYGFHGTLKAPFALAKGVSEADFLASALGFAAERKVIQIERLAVKRIDKFIALVPKGPCDALNEFAADCVRSFERYRAPLSGKDMARRRAAGLTARQDELLVQWGYPYVFDEFRFHLSLTGSLEKPERGNVRRLLIDLTEQIRSKPLFVRDLTIFSQKTRSSPFQVIARYPLAGSW